MNTNIFTLKNIGFALLALSALAMVIMSMTGTAITVDTSIAGCTAPAQELPADDCGIEISEKKISGFFIATIIVGVLGLASLVANVIKERKIG